MNNQVLVRAPMKGDRMVTCRIIGVSPNVTISMTGLICIQRAKERKKEWTPGWIDEMMTMHDNAMNCDKPAMR